VTTAHDTATAAAPAAGKLFYGWKVVAAAFTVLFVGYGLQFSFGVFVTEITKDTGWSRSQLVLPYAVYVALYSALSSVSGWATDRWGPARVVALGSVILGLGWAGFGMSHSLWQVYLSLGLVAAIGMSATWVPCNATVVRWFVRRRGLAVGAASSGGSMGNLVAPPVAAALVGLFGWRSTLPLMGLVGTAILLFCSRFLVRDPERLGLHPDGSPSPPVATATSVADEDSFTPAQARRTGTFWCLFSLFALTWLAVFVPFAHLVAFAKDLGYHSLAASLLLSAIGFGGVIGRLGAGPVSDRIGRRNTLALMLALQIVAFIGFASSHNLLLLYPSAVLFGFSYGGSVTLFPALVGDQFGRVSAGTIVGMIFAGAGSLAAVGPFVAAALYDATNSYRVAFLLCGAANVGALVLVTLLRPPQMPVPVPAMSSARAAVAGT
jgi:MFS family permease